VNGIKDKIYLKFIFAAASFIILIEMKPRQELKD